LTLLNEAILHSIEEPESCEYILNVHAGALCKIPAFLPIDRKPTPLKIDCQPVLSGIEYEKYLANKKGKYFNFFKLMFGKIKYFLAEEALKAEEDAARKFHERAKKLEMDERKAKAKAAQLEKEAIDEKPHIVDSVFGKSNKKAKKSVLHVLGKSKKEFLDATTEDGKKEKSTAAPTSADEDDAEFIGAEGTVEYEYMTNWLEDTLSGESFFKFFKEKSLGKKYFFF
jgi:hypothetical protein